LKRNRESATVETYLSAELSGCIWPEREKAHCKSILSHRMNPPKNLARNLPTSMPSSISLRSPENKITPSSLPVSVVSLASLIRMICSSCCG
jgi:hypothetical protein